MWSLKVLLAPIKGELRIQEGIHICGGRLGDVQNNEVQGVLLQKLRKN